MQILIITAAAIFGLIVGSFLNVVIYRMNTGKGLGGRSKCLSCGKTLAWYELIPVFSFLVQKGKCRGCRTHISWQYAAVEGITAALFAGVAASYYHFLVAGLPGIFAYMLAFWFLLISVGVVMSGYDIRHKLIHLPTLTVFLALTVVGGVFGRMGAEQFVPSLTNGLVAMNALAAVVVPLPFFLLWLFSKGRLMGLGDIEVMVGIGFMFGIVSGFAAVTLAFWVGTVVIMGLVLGRRIIHGERETDRHIPFAPFLLAGMYLVGVLGYDLFAIILGLR